MSPRPAVFTALTCALLPLVAESPAQDAAALKEYAGGYRWDDSSFVYLQPWAELTGKNQLVAFDESGEIRALAPAGRDHFVAGTGLPSVDEGLVDFQRDSAGRIRSMSWRAGSASGSVRRGGASEGHSVSDQCFRRRRLAR